MTTCSNLIELLIQTCLYSPLLLAVYISYRLMKTTDLTIEGTFVTGAVITALTLRAGYGWPIGVLAATLSGGLVGSAISRLHHPPQVTDLMASLVALFLLQGINFILLQRPNVALFQYALPSVKTLCLLVLVVVLGLIGLLYTRVGLVWRAFGDLKKRITAYEYSPEHMAAAGLGLTNALAAFKGATAALQGGFTDLFMAGGQGLTAITLVVLSEFCERKLNPHGRFHLGGSLSLLLTIGLLYHGLLDLLLRMELDPFHLRVVLGVLLIGALRCYK